MEQMKQRRLPMLPLIMLMMTVAANYLQWWYSSHYCCRGGSSYGDGALNFNNCRSIKSCDVNQIMMLMLWRRPYSMTAIVLMMSAAAIN